MGTWSAAALSLCRLGFSLPRVPEARTRSGEQSTAALRNPVAESFPCPTRDLKTPCPPFPPHFLPPRPRGILDSVRAAGEETPRADEMKPRAFPQVRLLTGGGANSSRVRRRCDPGP